MFQNDSARMISIFVIARTRHMSDQEDKIILGKLVSDNKNQQRKSSARLGQTCSRSLIVFFVPRFCDLVDYF